MRNLLDKEKKGITEETKGLLKFMTIPMVVVILIIVIVILDKPDTENGGSGDTAIESSDAGDGTETAQAETAVKEPDIPEIVLTEEAVPEVHDLMESYFKARRTCDTEALSQVYGGTCDQVALNGERIKMEDEVKFYKSFDNLVCYTAPGLEEGDYVVYARYDIKFRQADTLAPSMIMGYVKTAADGICYLVAETSMEQSAYMERANETEAVQAMQKEVNQKLSQALNADENLLAVYHMLMDEKSEGSLESEESQSEESGQESSPTEAGEAGERLPEGTSEANGPDGDS